MYRFIETLPIPFVTVSFYVLCILALSSVEYKWNSAHLKEEETILIRWVTECISHGDPK